VAEILACYLFESEALNYPARTVETIIKKFLEMKKLERIGEGRATRYKVR